MELAFLWLLLLDDSIPVPRHFQWIGLRLLNEHCFYLFICHFFLFFITAIPHFHQRLDVGFSHCFHNFGSVAVLPLLLFLSRLVYRLAHVQYCGLYDRQIIGHEWLLTPLIVIKKLVVYRLPLDRNCRVWHWGVESFLNNFCIFAS